MTPASGVRSQAGSNGVNGRAHGGASPPQKAVAEAAAKGQDLQAASAAALAVQDPRERIADLLPNLRAFAIGLSRNVATADDLVQETILKAWSNIDKFDPATNLEAWLFTILRNTYYSMLRKTRREVADSDGAYAATLFDRPAHDGRLAFGDFQRAFDQLSPEHREVLILIGASGYSCEEAAEMMGVATGTVKSRASRARKRLSELMGMAEGEALFSSSDSATTSAVMSRSATLTL